MAQAVRDLYQKKTKMEDPAKYRVRVNNNGRYSHTFKLKSIGESRSGKRH